jgi:hypothetical protein
MSDQMRPSVNFSRSEYTDRLTKVRGAMSRAGIDLLIEYRAG